MLYTTDARQHVGSVWLVTEDIVLKVMPIKQNADDLESA